MDTKSNAINKNTVYCHVCHQLWIRPDGFFSGTIAKVIDGITYPCYAHRYHTQQEVIVSYRAFTQEA